MDGIMRLMMQALSCSTQSSNRTILQLDMNENDTKELEDLPKVKLDLTSVDGNAFHLMGAFRQASGRKGSGWKKDQSKVVIDECMVGDYDHLVQTLVTYTV